MRALIRAYIEKYQLLTMDQPVLVGVSGGADSIALLTLLVESGYSCIAAHCNFHLRGEESQRDEFFAASYAAKLQVPFCKVDFDTVQYAESHQVSIEMAARELRYDWFEQQRIKWNAQAIAVAHHRDDSVETVLLNLMRGTGIRGMRGIQPRNGYVVRPFLAVSRETIEEWLAERQIPFITDSTNLSDEYTRNFIRLRVLPLLEELNPSVRETIARTAENLSATAEIYTEAIASARKKVFVTDNQLSIKELLAYPAPETLLYEFLSPFGFSAAVTTEVFRSLHGESGKQFYSSDYRLLKDRESLILSLREQKTDEIYLITEKTTVIRNPIELTLDKFVLFSDFTFCKEKHIAYFDADKLNYPLSLRRWKKGDWFIPFGMKGRKKLSDYFSDRKFNLLEKEEAWLLCSGENILWIVGERADNRCRVTSTTKNVLAIKFFR